MEYFVIHKISYLNTLRPFIWNFSIPSETRSCQTKQYSTRIAVNVCGILVTFNYGHSKKLDRNAFQLYVCVNKTLTLSSKVFWTAGNFSAKMRKTRVKTVLLYGLRLYRCHNVAKFGGLQWRNMHTVFIN